MWTQFEALPTAAGKAQCEVIDMTMPWTAVESMATSGAAERASPEQEGQLRTLFGRFGTDPSSEVDEHGQANMAFQQAIIRLSGIELRGAAHVEQHGRMGRKLGA